MIKGLIFDFDGTIMDSMHVWMDFGRRYLSSIGIDPPADIDDIIYTFDIEQTVEYFMEHFETGMDAPTMKRSIIDFMGGVYANEVVVKPGAVEYVKRMRALGMRMCIATASVREHVLASSDRNGITDLFDFILTTDEVGKGKDNPDIFLECAGRMGLPVSECAVFEDSFFAGSTARKAGFTLVGVYDKNCSEESREQLKSISDCFVTNLNTLPEQPTGR